MRNFYLQTADPQRAPRMAPVVHAVRRLLAQHKSVAYRRVLETAEAAGDLQRNSIKAWIAGATKAGLIRQAGQYNRQGPVDHRRLSLGDWPDRYHPAG